MSRFALILAGLVVAAGAVFAETDAPERDVIAAAILRVEHPRPLPISRLNLPPEDLGLAGARLGVADNNTTGAFLGQDFTLEEVSVPPEEAVAEMRRLVAAGVGFVATLADPETTLALADAAGDDVLVLNALAADDRLRGADCQTNLLHLVPSRAMLTDAVAQFLMAKRWSDWLLVVGSHPADALLAESYERSAEKFGANVVEIRVFADAGGARRTDSGHVQVQAQLPVFMQRAPDHDVVIAVDENEVFSTYLPYHTWEPRPVAGSAGLTPTAWHPALEAWGATQLQNRFEAATGRYMRPEDYAAWLAMRVVGEAATRTSSGDAETLRAYVLGPEFELGAFKGQPVTFRDWDGQLRQPILLAGRDVVVSVSPQDGYLHERSVLDTLGTDRPETDCCRD